MCTVLSTCGLKTAAFALFPIIFQLFWFLPVALTSVPPFHLTLSELSRYDGVRNPQSFVSVNFQIFNVTSNQHIYVSSLSGRDITRLLEYSLAPTSDDLVVWDTYKNLSETTIDKILHLYKRLYRIVGYTIYTKQTHLIDFDIDKPCTAQMNMTIKQLRLFDGKQRNCIFVAIKRTIFDVTARPDIYGLDGMYLAQVAPAGRDITRAAVQQNDRTPPTVHECDNFSDLPAKRVEALLNYYKANYPIVGEVVRPDCEEDD